MIWVGIDPGLTGAIAALNDDGKLLRLDDMPVLGGLVAARELCALLPTTDGQNVRVFVEQQQPFPRQGVSSSFRTGMNYGVLLSALALSDLSYTIVPATKWMRSVGQTADKARVLLNARARWPLADLRLAKHEGRAHALWIAEYGRVSEKPKAG